jgi:hypothetical protein
MHHNAHHLWDGRWKGGGPFGTLAASHRRQTYYMCVVICHALLLQCVFMLPDFHAASPHNPIRQPELVCAEACPRFWTLCILLAHFSFVSQCRRRNAKPPVSRHNATHARDSAYTVGR